MAAACSTMHHFALVAHAAATAGAMELEGVLVEDLAWGSCDMEYPGWNAGGLASESSAVLVGLIVAARPCVAHCGSCPKLHQTLGGSGRHHKVLT